MRQQTPCLLIVTHAFPGDDGGGPIVDYLGQKYDLMATNAHASGNIAGAIARHRKTSTPGTIVAEGPYPLNAAGIVSKIGVPPQAVTHVLAIVDARIIPSDPRAAVLRQIATLNGVTAYALGHIDLYDPESTGATRVSVLGKKALGLLSFVETLTHRPVAFLATGTAIVDREAMPAHLITDTTRQQALGTGAAGVIHQDFDTTPPLPDLAADGA